MTSYFATVECLHAQIVKYNTVISRRYSWRLNETNDGPLQDCLLMMRQAAHLPYAKHEVADDFWQITVAEYGCHNMLSVSEIRPDQFPCCIEATFSIHPDLF